jgi:hypothetical protein
MAKTTKEKSTDVFVGTAQLIEELEPEKLEAHALWCLGNVDCNYFELGGTLSRIQREKVWMGKATSFAEYVQTVFGMKYRKANYLMTTYTRLLNSEVPWSKVEGLGWSILKDISAVITPENVDEWVVRAHTLSRPDLQQAVAQALSGTLPKGNTDEPPANKHHNMTFKFHEDQYESVEMAIERAKGEAETEYPAVAMEAICLSYLAGANGKPDLKAVMAANGYERVLEVFAELWPEVDLIVDPHAEA